MIEVVKFILECTGIAAICLVGLGYQSHAAISPSQAVRLHRIADDRVMCYYLDDHPGLSCFPLDTK